MHLIKCCIMQSVSLETIISAHIALIHVLYCFEAKSSLCPSLPLLLSFSLSSVFSLHFCLILCYPLHLANSSLFPYFLSGAFVD